MAQGDSNKTRPKSENPNFTQFDIELIGAAKRSKEVELYFSVSSFAANLPDLLCKVVVVDRYMLKLSDLDGNTIGWIQKSLLAGVKVR